MGWGLVFMAAAAVVGMIEWIKKLVPNAPTTVWHIMLLPSCLAIGLLLPGGIEMKLLAAGVLLLVTQVGYQLIIQGVLGAVKAAVARAGK